MADSRTKNATRNMTSGIVNKLATIVLMFISRTVILYLLGANFLGIGTLFTSVLSFLSLAELGLSSEIVFSKRSTRSWPIIKSCTPPSGRASS